MPTEPPPPRYRVIERGRRLEVIDTASGRPVAPPPPVQRHAREAPTTALGKAVAPNGLIERTGFDGRAILSTRAWFDDKAPRRLILDPVTAQQIDGARVLAIGAAVALAIAVVFQPVVMVALLALASPRVRAALRKAATAWLDRLDPANDG